VSGVSLISPSFFLLPFDDDSGKRRVERKFFLPFPFSKIGFSILMGIKGIFPPFPPKTPPSSFKIGKRAFFFVFPFSSPQEASGFSPFSPSYCVSSCEELEDTPFPSSLSLDLRPG